MVHLSGWELVVKYKEVLADNLGRADLASRVRNPSVGWARSVAMSCIAEPRESRGLASRSPRFHRRSCPIRYEESHDSS